MKLNSILTGIIISLFSIVFSRVSAQHLLEKNDYNTIFFEVSHPESNNVSYLFGTHHAFSKSFFETLDVPKKKLQESNVVILESLDIPGQNSEDIINARTKTTNWRKYLSQDDLIYAQNLLKNGPVNFDKLTPTELYITLARVYYIKVCAARTNDDSNLTLDGYIGSIAKQNNATTIGLETVKEQLEIINKDVAGMPRKVHEKRLNSLIDLLRNNTRTRRCEDSETYRNQEFIYNLDYECQNNLMLTDRNNKWMQVIPERIMNNNCFIAVGLSHLRFKCGLISQLRDMGFRVLPIKTSSFLGSYFKNMDFSKGAVKLEPNLISTNQIEYNTSFDVQSQTLYYTISSSDWSESNIMKSQFQNGAFSKPEKVKFDGRFYNNADVHIQSDGQYLYYIGDDSDIWRSKRKDGQWSKLEKLPSSINSIAPEAYPITTNSGNLYFSRASRASSYDIYVARYNNGKYEEAIKLPSTINSDLLESDAWVAPDESFMIFARKDDPNGFGVTDLYISFNESGQWTEAKNLGQTYNSEGVDGSPWLTPDYKYLFLTSTRYSPNPKQFDGGLDLYVMEFNLNNFKK